MLAPFDSNNNTVSTFPEPTAYIRAEQRLYITIIIIHDSITMTVISQHITLSLSLILAPADSNNDTIFVSPLIADNNRAVQPCYI